MKPRSGEGRFEKPPTLIAQKLEALRWGAIYSVPAGRDGQAAHYQLECTHCGALRRIVPDPRRAGDPAEDWGPAHACRPGAVSAA